MSDQINEFRKKLDEKIPRDVVKEREGGGNRTFSYLEGHYVIARMNEIFGQGNWAYVAEEAKCVHTGEVNGKFVAHYIARVRLEVPALRHALFVDYGYGDGSDKSNPGKAHELAVKEAVTDGLKRAAKNLGMSMGLALYDKEQVNVEENTNEDKAEARGASYRARPAAMGAVRGEPAKTVSPSTTNGSADAPPADREKLNAMLTSMSKVILTKAGQKKAEKLTELQGLIKKYGAEKKEQLTDPQAREFYAVLKGMM